MRRAIRHATRHDTRPTVAVTVRCVQCSGEEAAGGGGAGGGRVARLEASDGLDRRGPHTRTTLLKNIRHRKRRKPIPLSAPL